MIRGKFFSSMDDTTQIIALRRKVFCEEMGMPIEYEPDEYDKMSVYALVYNDDNEPIGTGRLYIQDDKFHIGRVCVLKEWRNMKIGDFIMRMLLYRAQDLNAASVTLSAKADKVNFYAKYGFEPVGEVFEFGGVPQRMMHVEGEKINIEGTCHCNSACAGCEGNCDSCEENTKNG